MTYATALTAAIARLVAAVAEQRRESCQAAVQFPHLHRGGALLRSEDGCRAVRAAHDSGNLYVGLGAGKKTAEDKVWWLVFFNGEKRSAPLVVSNEIMLRHTLRDRCMDDPSAPM